MFQLYSSIGANSENNVDPLGCDESTLSTEKSLVDATQRESKSECSEENIELKQQELSGGGLAYSLGTFENIRSSVQVSNFLVEFLSPLMFHINTVHFQFLSGMGIVQN